MKELLKEHLQILRVGFPAFLFVMLNNVLFIANSIFLGQGGGSAAEIAGMGIGASFTTIVCNAFVTGLNNSVEILAAQSFGGGEFQVAGLQLKRGRVIVVVATVPLLVVLYFAEEILLGLGLEEAVSLEAGKYCRWMVPGTAIWCVSDLQSQFLNCIQLTKGPFLAQLLATLLHLACLALFVLHLRLAVVGAALANSLSTLATLLFMLAYQTYIVPSSHPVHRIVAVEMHRQNLQP